MPILAILALAAVVGGVAWALNRKGGPADLPIGEDQRDGPGLDRRTEIQTPETLAAETDDIAGWFLRSLTNGGGDRERAFPIGGSVSGGRSAGILFLGLAEPRNTLSWRRGLGNNGNAVRMTDARRYPKPHMRLEGLNQANAARLLRTRIYCSPTAGGQGGRYRVGLVTAGDFGLPVVSGVLPSLFERIPTTADPPGVLQPSVRAFVASGKLCVDVRDSAAWYPFEDANPTVRYYTSELGRTALVVVGGRTYALPAELWTPRVSGGGPTVYPRSDWYPYDGNGLRAIGWIGGWFRHFLALPVFVPPRVETLPDALAVGWQVRWTDSGGGRWRDFIAYRARLVAVQEDFSI